MTAERKLDRLKSKVVNETWSQSAQSNVKQEEKSPKEEEANGIDQLAAVSGDVELARKEAVAVSEKRKGQIEQLAAENKKLTDELTAMTVKLSALGDDDFAKTDLFKQLKTQHEDVIKRVNHLEKTNNELREESQKLQAERTAYRMQIDEESRMETKNAENEQAKAENDLARIRAVRDEMQAELSQKRQTTEEGKVASEHLKESAIAKDHRIRCLEAEIEKLQTELGQIAAPTSERLDQMSPEELRTKTASLQQEAKLLTDELNSMQAAYTKAQSLATKKVAEITHWEEQVSRSSAEKAKADQKYFAAMKGKESKEAEVRALKLQNAKSSEIVSQLKESHARSRVLIVNLEKQIAEVNHEKDGVAYQLQKISEENTQSTVKVDRLDGQVTELKKAITAKDERLSSLMHAQREADVELESLKTRLDDVTKRNEELKKKAKGQSTGIEDILREMAYCSTCHRNLKDRAIKTCGHLFCNSCLTDRINNRMRKCPTCMKGFGAADVLEVHLS
ncbi:hypothetical protein LTS18_001326 [Coniosporium uncinatum]|uniref:Uncharacterized protein n=1 Tax=Coniosporium uncinatum TaxID=93489 RepID=A0ACC3D8B9_9PEZI|nr:hypothetical protein LTS18_001326 [Coniosporium uncinatum]